MLNAEMTLVNLIKILGAEQRSKGMTLYLNNTPRNLKHMERLKAGASATKKYTSNGSCKTTKLSLCIAEATIFYVAIWNLKAGMKQFSSFILNTRHNLLFFLGTKNPPGTRV